MGTTGVVVTDWGIPVHRGMGTTGVVGIVHGRDGGKSGRAIGLRADMDALPMQEFNTFAHASKHQGKMHACGHDGHTSMLLGAAHHLAQHRDFDGTVYLIFQPAEEGRPAGEEGGADLHAVRSKGQCGGNPARVGNTARRDDGDAHGIDDLWNQREGARQGGFCAAQEGDAVTPCLEPGGDDHVDAGLLQCERLADRG
eukprot:gene36495-59617_t